MKHLIVFMITWLALHVSNAQYDPHAGLVFSYTSDAEIEASSTAIGSVENTIDGDLGSEWQSTNPLPLNFFSRSDQNILLNQASYFSFSKVNRPENVYNGNLSGTTEIVAANGLAYLEVNFAGGKKELSWLSTRPKLNVGQTALIYGFNNESDSSLLYTLTSDENYTTVGVPVQGNYSALKIYSAENFELFELAAISGYPKEYITFDLKSARQVGSVRIKAYNTAAYSCSIYTSTDHVNWTKQVEVDPTAWGYFTIRLPEETAVRYIKVEQELELMSYVKAKLFEFSVYDNNGIFGPQPEFEQSPNTIMTTLGVNGVWGWGGASPTLYSLVASHARNYHNWDWDVTDPDIAPDYTIMANGGGTEANWWLNWNSEYSEWKSAGFSIGCSIQFNKFSENDFQDPYQAGFNYGLNFSSHFGPNGYDLVDYLEVGNEPWHFDNGMYREILRGMANGVHQGDDDMQVMPGAFQAYDSLSQYFGGYMNYVGSKISASEVTLLDVLNTHAYSYKAGDNGQRVATYPEDFKSSFNQIYNMIRWRDRNMPSKPVFLTEWGWDFPGGNQDCLHSECVSEKAASDYTIRGLMKAMRSGISRATWFFYANTSNESSLYTRSGLTTNESDGHQKKRVFYAFQQLLDLVPDKKIVGIYHEDDEGYIYLLGDGNNPPSHLIAWLPIEGDNPLTSTVKLAPDYLVQSAYRLDGSSEKAPRENMPAPDMILLSSTPLLVELQPVVTALDNRAANNIVVYPNMVSGQFRIKGIPDYWEEDLLMTDPSGRNISFQYFPDDKLVVPDNELKSGVYLLRVRDRKTGERIIRKLVVVK